jgi:deoxyadenosine/deoxycytidine kinase
LYEVLTLYLPPPDLVVYLRANTETLIKRITLRGREYERDISPDYLARLNDLYDEWIENFTLCPVLTIPADELDYVHQDGHLDIVTSVILKRLQGKEVVSFN